jgi:hemerythrin superfamily protein
MKQMLEEIKSMNPSNIDDFKAKVQQLMSAVLKHVQEEENDMFPKIRDNFSDEQQKQMATQFKEAKSRLQQEMAASK